MPKKVEQPEIICRPAQPEDTSDVLEFTQFTWEDGRDYIKYVWEEWLTDDQGILAAAEYNGRCVGFAKATLSAPGQWLFEGFRVDPNYQGLASSEKGLELGLVTCKLHPAITGAFPDLNKLISHSMPMVSGY